MGKLARRFKRSNNLEMPVTKSEFDFIYSMVHNKMAAQVEENVKTRIVPAVRADLRKEVAAEVTNDVYAHFLAIASNILMNDYGKMKSKDTRLKVFYDKLQEYSGEIENPSEQQLEAEKALAEQVDGIEIKR